MMKCFSSLNGSLRRRKSGRRASGKSDTVTPKVKSKSKLIDEEDAATGSVGLDVYIRYFKSIGITMAVSAILCNAIQQTASIYSNSKYFFF